MTKKDKPKPRCTCGSNKVERVGRKWLCVVTCKRCGKKLIPTFEEFYGNGVVD